MKKFITIVLAFVLMLSVMPMALSASAEELQKVTLYSFEDESMDGITSSIYTCERTTNYANEGSYSLMLQNKTVNPTQNAAVTEACFTERVEFSIPDSINVQGNVGFYMSMSHTMNVWAYGLKTADGSYYLTHAHRFDRNTDNTSASDHNTANTFYKINVTGDKVTNGSSRTYYKYGDDTVTKSFDYTNFASDANAQDKVTDIVVFLLSYARPDVNKNTQYFGYVDSIYYETVAETDGTITDAISTKPGASIRLSETINGIRFYTTYDSSKIDGTVVEKGTLIGPANIIGDYLTIDDVTAKNAVAVKYGVDTLWDGNEFVGSIVGIQEKNYNREFTARAYVKLSDGSYFYSATTTTKTVAGIADDFIADATKEGADESVSNLYKTYKETVDAWAKANDPVDTTAE